jgi:hypothetical protein
LATLNNKKVVLYQLALDRSGERPTVAISLESKRAFSCEKKCNFRGAAGTQIDEQGRLKIISTSMYRQDQGRSISLVEFFAD